MFNIYGTKVLPQMNYYSTMLINNELRTLFVSWYKAKVFSKLSLPQMS